MPRRSNSFQRLVRLIEKQLFEDGSVRESALIEGREIDVLIEVDAGEVTFRVAVECRDHSRPQDVTWIEELIGKYSEFPVAINKVFAVSRKGFTSGAKEKADESSVDLELMTFEKAECIDWGRFQLLRDEVGITAITISPAKTINISAPPLNFPGEFLETKPDIDQLKVEEKGSRLLEYISDQFRDDPNLYRQTLQKANNVFSTPEPPTDELRYFSIANRFPEGITLRDSRGVRYELDRVIQHFLCQASRTSLSLGESIYRNTRIFSGTGSDGLGEIEMSVVLLESEKGHVDIAFEISDSENDWTVEITDLPFETAKMDYRTFSVAEERIKMPEGFPNNGTSGLPDYLLR